MLPSWVASGFVAAYISYHQNVPTLVQLMLWYFGISSLLPDSLQIWLSDHNGEALFAIGAAALLLLFIGIHNAWDAVTYHLLTRKP